MTAGPTVAVVHLGTPGSMGGLRRVANLTSMFEAAGASVVDVRLMVDHRLGPSDVLHLGLGAVASGRAVPESLAWSHRSLLRHLHQVGADVVVCGTARSFHPSLLDGPWTIVVDYVDRLSDSYRDRAEILGRSARSALFRVLAATAGRHERRSLPAGVEGIAAGWADAEALGVAWVPMTVDLPPERSSGEPTHDLLLFGKLSYPPNVEAIERLGRVWPQVQAARPATTLVLAGAAPTSAVLDRARQHGWTVVADFERLDDIIAMARVATAPLTYASGIQSKVLEAAAYGMPQVISTAVSAGFGDRLPARIIDDDDALVTALVELLDDPAEQEALGTAARVHVADEYSVERWVPWARTILARR